jgi:hypothetical protein
VPGQKESNKRCRKPLKSAGRSITVHQAPKLTGIPPPAPEAVLPPPDMTIETWLISKELDKQMVKRLVKKSYYFWGRATPIGQTRPEDIQAFINSVTDFGI